jgi:hypothetical protein
MVPELKSHNNPMIPLPTTMSRNPAGQAFT